MQLTASLAAFHAQADQLLSLLKEKEHLHVSNTTLQDELKLAKVCVLLCRLRLMSGRSCGGRLQAPKWLQAAL